MSYSCPSYFHHQEAFLLLRTCVSTLLSSSRRTPIPRCDSCRAAPLERRQRVSHTFKSETSLQSLPILHKPSFSHSSIPSALLREHDHPRQQELQHKQREHRQHGPVLLQPRPSQKVDRRCVLVSSSLARWQAKKRTPGGPAERGAADGETDPEEPHEDGDEGG